MPVSDLVNFTITRYKITIDQASLTYEGNQYTRFALINCLGPNISTDILKSLNICFMDIDKVPPSTTRAVGNQFVVTMFSNDSNFLSFLVDLFKDNEKITLQFSLMDPTRNRLITSL